MMQPCQDSIVKSGVYFDDVLEIGMFLTFKLEVYSEESLKKRQFTETKMKETPL